jgi:hypothetical protein
MVILTLENKLKVHTLGSPCNKGTYKTLIFKSQNFKTTASMTVSRKMEGGM